MSGSQWVTTINVWDQISTPPREHKYTKSTFDLSLGQVELIWLVFAPPQRCPTCQGQWRIDPWHNTEAQRVWALLQKSLVGCHLTELLVQWVRSNAWPAPLRSHWIPYAVMNIAMNIQRSLSSCLKRVRLFFSNNLKRCHMLWNVKPQCENLFKKTLVVEEILEAHWASCSENVVF